MSLSADAVILRGKYRVLRLVGEGASARVWEAEEPGFAGRRVALKEPARDRLAADEVQEYERRFQTEIVVARMLGEHSVPNTVRAFTVEPMPKATSLLVMEYMPGGSLADRISAHPAGMPIEMALTITRSLCEALSAFHELPSAPVHRDVKPSNVLFNAADVACLSDFGLTELPGASARSKLVGTPHPGTPLYMAPEQARSPEPLHPSADLFALGCILFEILTARRYKRERPGTRVRALRQDAPQWLDDIVARALLDDPWPRWQSAREIVAALADGEARARQAILAEEYSQAQPAADRVAFEAEAHGVRLEDEPRSREDVACAESEEAVRRESPACSPTSVDAPAAHAAGERELAQDVPQRARRASEEDGAWNAPFPRHFPNEGGLRDGGGGRTSRISSILLALCFLLVAAALWLERTANRGPSVVTSPTSIAVGTSAIDASRASSSDASRRPSATPRSVQPTASLGMSTRSPSRTMPRVPHDPDIAAIVKRGALAADSGGAVNAWVIEIPAETPVSFFLKQTNTPCLPGPSTTTSQRAAFGMRIVHWGQSSHSVEVGSDGCYQELRYLSHMGGGSATVEVYNFSPGSVADYELTIEGAIVEAGAP